MNQLRSLAVLLVVTALLTAMPTSREPAGAWPLLPAPEGGADLLVESQGLFDFLFGSPSRSRVPPADVGSSRGSTSASPSPAPQRSAPEPSTPKDPNAKKVYIFGDAFASGLHTGLEYAFAETATIEVVKRTKPGSGIVRDDYYDWQTNLAQILETEQVDIAVMMIGSNDRQPIRLEEGEAEVRSEKWEQLYISRIDRLLRQFSDRKIPVYWVGLPIMRPQRYGQDIAYFNQVYQARVQRAGGKFIDMWSRFADEEGRYSAAGPDINGKIRRLRNDNGIHMTRNGNIKLAFFVEQQLRSDLETGGVFANVPLLEPGATSTRPTGPVEMEISLTSPEEARSETELLGSGEEERDGARYEELPDYQLLVVGKSPQPKPGRADDFSWPPGAEKSGQDAASKPQS